MEKGRRTFLKSVAAGIAGGGAIAVSAHAAQTETRLLQVWSCGGLAEAMDPAHHAYTAKTGVEIAYTGAFAGALGKSLLSGSGTTEVFCGRVLQLAKNLRKAGKMKKFVPLCFTNYGIAVPKGNPRGIGTLEDLAKKGIRVAMAPLSSPPGSGSVMMILKKTGLTEKIMANVLDKRASCIQTTITDVIDGKADAMIVERRITRFGRFAPHLDYIALPDEIQPEGPLTFTVGIMEAAKALALAEQYVAWITSPEGQKFFEDAGFISAYSEKGLQMTKQYGVYDA